MPSDGPAPDLAGPPPGWRVGACLSSRNGTHVHRAEHSDGRVALLKRLDRAAPDPLTRLRFQREARLARLLAHPGLAALLASGEDWLLFEWLAPSLVDRRETFADWAKLVPLLAGIAQTLTYLHGRGVVHQDVKPAHILFRGSRAVLVDLGAAGLVADDPIIGREAVGAEAWASPEQWAGAAPRPAADIWSLARLAGWCAGEAGWTQAPEPLGAILPRCLASDPSARPSAATLLETFRDTGRFAPAPGAL
ncbi:protein kinase domain-containing protein [Aureimonas ureilytica]|uniref:protein kinase domain-containing protein n=1 Tax=Aureimonas ureilytica TaxID=401562 RepID=UPI0003673397|nr:protein kinase [Aureimonas ureilytica]